MAMQSIYFLLFLLASTCGLPVRYDQRQDGDLNVHAHLENFIIVFIPGTSSALSLLDVIPLKKDANRHQATGVKLSAPDFPAAKSPYKVDLDKSEGEITKVQGDKPGPLEIVQEVMIAPVPAITITKPIDKVDNMADESTTLAAIEEDATQKAEEPAATEKVEKDGENNTEKKENVVVKNSEEKKVKDDNKDNALDSGNKKDNEKIKEEKKEENTEEKIEKDEKKEEKTENKENIGEKKEEKKPEESADEIPVIDSAPGKPVKASKSIDFGIEAARPGLQRVRGEEATVMDRAARVKVSKIPEYRHEIIGNPEFSQHLKGLRAGLNECQPGQTLTDDGQCVPAKHRQSSRSFFPSENRMLPILRFGLAPADSD